MSLTSVFFFADSLPIITGFHSQIDFGRTMEVTAIATQGHPREHKWVLSYVLKFSLGKHWLTYQESGRVKVRNSNSITEARLR